MSDLLLLSAGILVMLLGLFLGCLCHGALRISSEGVKVITIRSGGPTMPIGCFALLMFLLFIGCFAGGLYLILKGFHAVP